MKYLIVDDNAQFRTYLCSILVQLGDEYRELEDGTEVNEVYKRFKPDWVLLDIQMQPMNGFTAVQRLKQEFSDARIAIISNYTDRHYREKAAALGAAVFVAKDDLSDLEKILCTTPE
jgi:two-component system, NarL family, response regulator DegU